MKIQNALDELFAMVEGEPKDEELFVSPSLRTGSFRLLLVTILASAAAFLFIDLLLGNVSK